MKAIYFEEHGSIENLRYADLPEPTTLPGQALIKVKAVALNHLDIWVRRGWEGLHLALPHIGGSDIAGDLVSVNALSKWAPGSKVIVNPGVLSGEDEYTRRGEDSISPYYKILGEQLRGGMAEYVVVPVENIFKLPDTYSYAQGAAPILVSTTCWRMLFVRGNLKPGETVLVVGAGGGVNSIAIQFAKAAGAHIIVLAGNKAKAKKALEIGANMVIDYNEKQNWHVDVLKATKGRGVDLVVDNVGAKTYPKSIRSLRNGGRLVTVGNTSGSEVKLDNRLIFTKQISLLGSTMGSRQDFIDAQNFMLQQKIKPIIDCIEPLSKGIEMLQYLEKGEQFGKIVLSV